MLALFGVNYSQRKVKKSVTFQFLAEDLYDVLVSIIQKADGKVGLDVWSFIRGSAWDWRWWGIRSFQGDLWDHNASLMPMKGNGAEKGLARRDIRLQYHSGKVMVSPMWVIQSKQPAKGASQRWPCLPSSATIRHWLGAARVGGSGLQRAISGNCQSPMSS